jgi:hypothetical protein
MGVQATISLALSVAAAPAPYASSEYKCNIGPVQCCNQLQKGDSAVPSNSSSSVGLGAQGLTGLVGSNCSHRSQQRCFLVSSCSSSSSEAFNLILTYFSPTPTNLSAARTASVRSMPLRIALSCSHLTTLLFFLQTTSLPLVAPLAFDSLWF